MKNARLAARVHALPPLSIVDSKPLKRWPEDLGTPINAADVALSVRAHSILFGLVRDGSGLSASQAHDVIRWHERHLETINPKPRSWLQRLFRH